MVTRIDSCLANFKSRMKHLCNKIPNLDIGISMECHSGIGLPDVCNVGVQLVSSSVAREIRHEIIDCPSVSRHHCLW